MTSVMFGGMNPTHISPTIQQFDGQAYYCCGRYFQRDGIRLHRLVWQQFYGEIPPRHDVHHINHDPHDNRLENLVCLPMEVHQREHGKAHADKMRAMQPKAELAARAWHGTSAGRQWHSEHFDKHIRPSLARRVPMICQVCGRSFEVAAFRAALAKTCSGACRAKHFRTIHRKP